MTVYVWKDVSKHPDVIRLELTEAVTTIDISSSTADAVEVEEPQRFVVDPSVPAANTESAAEAA